MAASKRIRAVRRQFGRKRDGGRIISLARREIRPGDLLDRRRNDGYEQSAAEDGNDGPKKRGRVTVRVVNRSGRRILRRFRPAVFRARTI